MSNRTLYILLTIIPILLVLNLAVLWQAHRNLNTQKTRELIIVSENNRIAAMNARIAQAFRELHDAQGDLKIQLDHLPQSPELRAVNDRLAGIDHALEQTCAAAIRRSPL